MKNVIVIILCLCVFSGCKKPKIGSYALTLTYDQSNMGVITIYGDEIRVTSKNIYYGGAFSNISGTLNKKFKKVDGDLILFPNDKIKSTITVDGTIKNEGIGKHKIGGTFSNYPYTGKFEIKEI